MDVWLLLGIFVILDLALLTFAVVSRSGRAFSAGETRRYSQIWDRITRMDHRHAVMEADKLLHEVMEKRGYKGSVGDKLKVAGPAFTDLDGLWRAHKLRNRLAHELEAEISREQTKAALASFKRAYRDLGLKI